MMRVSIEIPPDTCFEVVTQSFDRNKSVGLLTTPYMAIIAFPGLVVVAQHAYALIDQRHPLLVGVAAPGELPRQAPDDDLGENAATAFHALANQWNAVRVALNSNGPCCCQWWQHRPLPNPPERTTSTLCPDRGSDSAASIGLGAGRDHWPHPIWNRSTSAMRLRTPSLA